MPKYEYVSQDQMDGALFTALENRELPDRFPYWTDATQGESFPTNSKLTTLLYQNLPRMKKFICGTKAVVAAGVGNGEKERLLLEQYSRCGCLPAFVAIDVNASMVDEAISLVSDLGAASTGIVGLIENLPELRQHWQGPAILTLLGNTFSGFDPDVLLPSLRQSMGPRDLLLMDVTLLSQKPAAGPIKAMASESDTRFHLRPLLSHGMRHENAVFEWGITSAQTPRGRVVRSSKRIEFLTDTTLRFRRGNLHFLAGEKIDRMGFCWQYTRNQVESILGEHRIRPISVFLDQSNENMLILARMFP